MVYGAIIVGKNSAYYWYDGYSNSNSPWINTPVPASKWWGRGLRDLAGFVVGFAVGSALAGPVGGVAAGTLVGGACSAD